MKPSKESHRNDSHQTREDKARETDIIDEILLQETGQHFFVSRLLQIIVFFSLACLWSFYAGLNAAWGPGLFIAVLFFSWRAQSRMRDWDQWHILEPMAALAESFLLATFIVLSSGIALPSFAGPDSGPADYLNWSWPMLFVIQTACVGLGGVRPALLATCCGALIFQVLIFTMVYADGSGTLSAAGEVPGTLVSYWLLPSLVLSLSAVAIVPFVFWTLAQSRRRLFATTLEHLTRQDSIAQIFGPHMPAGLAKALSASDKAVQKYGKAKKGDAVILAAHLAEAQTLSDRCREEELLRIIHGFRTLAAKQAAQHNGYAVPHGNYGVLVAFNLVWPEPQAAEAAVAMALDLHNALSTSSIGGRHIACTIGLHAGPTIGGIHRDETGYFIGGKAADTALRLAEICPTWDCATLLSHTAKSLAGSKIKSESIGSVMIPGLSEHITLYRLN